jgi:hypothetical protein
MNEYLRSSTMYNDKSHVYVSLQNAGFIPLACMDVVRIINCFSLTVNREFEYTNAHCWHTLNVYNNFLWSFVVINKIVRISWYYRISYFSIKLGLVRENRTFRNICNEIFIEIQVENQLGGLFNYLLTLYRYRAVRAYSYPLSTLFGN